MKPLVIALLTLTLAGGLPGCGLKGALYLPQQKKTRVPESPGNSAPEPQGTVAPDAPPPAGDSASRG